MSQQITICVEDGTEPDLVLKVPIHSTVQSLCYACARHFSGGTTKGSWGIYEITGTSERWLPEYAVISRLGQLSSGKLEWRDRDRMAEVTLLNGTRFTLRIDDSATLGSILKTIGRKQGLSEDAVSEYGLKFAGKLHAGLNARSVLTSGWLRPDWTLQQHGARKSTALKFNLLKRWYFSDHGGVQMNEAELHFVFLECKDKFLSDHYELAVASERDILSCVASLLFIDHSKYDRKKHTTQWFKGKRYFPESWSEVVNATSAARAWKSISALENVTASQRKKKFVSKCRQFGGFGATFFKVRQGQPEEKHSIILSIDKDFVRFYLLWSPQQVKNRRLSRNALALSPRGPPPSEADGGDGTSPISKSPGSRFRTIGRRKKTRASVMPDNLTSSADQVEQPKSPRFRLKPHSKSSSNLTASMSSSPEQRGRRMSILAKKDAFKSFRGLKSLQKTQPRTTEDLKLSDTDGGSSGLMSSLKLDDGVEKREMTREIPLECIHKWCLGENQGIYFDLEGEPEPIVLYSDDQGQEICNLLQGYGNFRMEDLTLNRRGVRNAYATRNMGEMKRPIDFMFCETADQIARSTDKFISAVSEYIFLLPTEDDQGCGQKLNTLIKTKLQLKKACDAAVSLGRSEESTISPFLKTLEILVSQCTDLRAFLVEQEDVKVPKDQQSILTQSHALITAWKKLCDEAANCWKCKHTSAPLLLEKAIMTCSKFCILETLTQESIATLTNIVQVLGKPSLSINELLDLIDSQAPVLYNMLHGSCSQARTALCNLLTERRKYRAFGISEQLDAVLVAFANSKVALHSSFAQTDDEKTISDTSLSLASAIRQAVVLIGRLLDDYSDDLALTCAESIQDLANVAGKTMLITVAEQDRNRIAQVVSAFIAVTDVLIEWTMSTNVKAKFRVYGNKRLVEVLLRDIVKIMKQGTIMSGCSDATSKIQSSLNKISVSHKGISDRPWSDLSTETINQLRLFKIIANDVRSTEVSQGVLDSLCTTLCSLVPSVQGLVALLPAIGARASLVSQFQLLGARTVKLLDYVGMNQWIADSDADRFQKMHSSLISEVDVSLSVVKLMRDPKDENVKPVGGGGFRRRTLSISGAKQVNRVSIQL